MTGVTIICPNNRRVVVKLDPPGKTMFQVLDEACKKQGFVTESYCLKHQNKIVDLSLTFRLTGLPQNCTLNMEESLLKPRDEVDFALQMPDGQRFNRKVPADATLLDVLLDFETQNDLKLLEPEGEHVHPVCQYLNNEFIGALSLAATTLKSVGISGKVLFRYSVRQIEDEKLAKINEDVERLGAKQRKLEATFEKKVQENLEYENTKAEEASLIQQLAAAQPQSPPELLSPNSRTNIESTTHESMDYSNVSSIQQSPSQAPNSHAERLARINALQHMLAMVDSSIANETELPWDFDSCSNANTRQPDFSNFKFPEATKGMDLQSASPANSVTGTLIQPCDRRATAYRVDGQMDIGLIEPPPEFFEVSANDMQLQLQHLRELSSSQRLMFSESTIRRKEMEAKIKAYKYSVLRFQFSNGIILQGTFRSLEPISAVYHFIRENMENEKAAFNICLPPNVHLNKMDANLIQSNIAPRSTLIIRLKQSTDASDQILKPEIIASLKSQAEAELTAHECLLLNETYVPYRPPVVQENAQQQPNIASNYEDRVRPGSSTKSKSSGMPKWLKGP